MRQLQMGTMRAVESPRPKPTSSRLISRCRLGGIGPSHGLDVSGREMCPGCGEDGLMEPLATAS